MKYGTQPTSQASADLAWLRDRLGERFQAGFVVHMGKATPSRWAIACGPFRSISSATWTEA